MDVPAKKTIRVVVDECAGASSPLVARFRQTLAPDQSVEWVFLSQAHRAIPDNAILHRVLGSDTVLLTRDRVLHNQACILGFRSYTLDEHGNLRRRKVPGVPTPAPVPPKSKGPLKADYTHGCNPIASALKDSLSERALKRCRTRRRRIRSYFGSEAEISSLALTIGARTSKHGLIGGFFLAVAGHSGVPGIRASEGYALIGADDVNPASCLFHALQELYLLQLENIPTELYVIPEQSLALCEKLLVTDSSTVLSSPANAVRILLKGLAKARAFPCVKGRFFEAMESKLNQLAHGSSNELVSLPLGSLISALNQAVAQQPATSNQSSPA